MPSAKTTLEKKPRRGTPNYAAYIHKVLKQVHPDLQVSSKTIMVTNSLVSHVLEKLTVKGIVIAKEAKKSTLSSSHIQGAAQLCMPIGLSNHAVTEGTKAVSKFAA